MLPNKLEAKLRQRKDEKALRQLGVPSNLIDFASNDYLGFSKYKTIFNNASEILKRHNLQLNGATGSRLLSGNHAIYTETESIIANFHKSEAALIFNSGYDANLGLLSSVLQRGDIVFYDELCHASIRDGIRMSNAKSYKFAHNDLEDLKKRCQTECSRSMDETAQIYIVTESIFSMDGDAPDIKALVLLSKKYNCHVIIDEAHATGVLGENGEGLIQESGLENDVFARVITFGKAMGCHGAAVLGSKELISYLVNFARSFIYTTALPPHAIATIQAAYKELEKNSRFKKDLENNISILKKEIKKHQLEPHFISSNSAIHSCVIPGNVQVRKISEAIKNAGFDVKPILSPTVPAGQERLRICVHSFNTKDQILQLVACLAVHLRN